MYPVPSPRGIPPLAGLLLACSLPAWAQSTATPPTAKTTSQQVAYQSSIAEEAVRQQTSKIQAEINELVAELKLNGLDGADLAILANASNHLQTLSQEDMQKVIAALQNASTNSQDQGRQQSLVNAYQNQKEVSLELKSLAVDLALKESQKEIPSKLENLIARQSANIRQTSSFSAGAMAPSQLNAGQKSTQAVVVSEQTAIGGEIDLLTKLLSATPDAPPGDNTPNISKAVLDAINGSALKDTAAAATQLTSAGPFPNAVTKQTSVRDQLTAALRVSLSSLDAVTRLEEVKAQLSQLISDQQDLGAVTQGAKLDGPILAERQARIDDRTSVTQALLKPLNSSAADQVEQAQQAMGQSSSALAKAAHPADSAPQVQVVVVDLQKASALLDQQIAAAQSQAAASPVDKLAQLQQLQSDINQAQKNPQLTAADLQKLQQEALAPSAQAANKIADAADQLQQAQPNTAAANQALAQANDAVQQQEDALKQAAQAYQALNQASQQLAQAQQQAATAAQSLQNNAANNNFTAAARDLTQAQSEINQMNQTPPQGLPQDAQQALQQAAQALQNATTQAVQAQGANAQAQDQNAMTAMQQAQAGLTQAMAQVQQQAQGQGQGPGQKPGQGQGQAMAQGQGQQAQGKGGAADAPQSGGQVLGGFGAGGVAQVVGGLTTKDRDAITEYQAEKAPPQYAPMVQQYLKNLADSSDSH